MAFLRRVATLGLLAVGLSFLGALIATIQVLDNHLVPLEVEISIRRRPQQESSAARDQDDFLVSQESKKVDRSLHHTLHEQKKKVSDIPDEDSFAACLMMMDDNHFLVEWIAYHWFMLPLRHLTVLVDSKSHTSPLGIFDRWKDYMTIHVVNWTYPRDIYMERVPKELLPYPEIRNYLARQNLFYQDCMKAYKRNHWPGWLVFIDTDELLAVNHSMIMETPDDRYRGSDADENEHFDTPPNHEPGSVMKLLQQVVTRIEPDDDDRDELDCINTRRTQICHETEAIDKIQQATTDMSSSSSLSSRLGLDNVKDQDFLTQQWLRSNGPMGWRTPKTMLHIASLDNDYLDALDLVKDGSAHRLTPDRNCPTYPYFQIYHYHGSVEQRTFRDKYDPRGPFGNRIGASRLLGANGDCKGLPGDDLKPWLQGFVAAVGVQEAKRLLEGVGRVHSWPAYAT